MNQSSAFNESTTSFVKSGVNVNVNVNPSSIVQLNNILKNNKEEIYQNSYNPYSNVNNPFNNTFHNENAIPSGNIHNKSKNIHTNSSLSNLNQTATNTSVNNNSKIRVVNESIKGKKPLNQPASSHNIKKK